MATFGGFSVIEPLHSATLGLYKWTKLTPNGFNPEASIQFGSRVHHMKSAYYIMIEPWATYYMPFDIKLEVPTQFIRPRYEAGPDLPHGLVVESKTFTPDELNNIVIPIFNPTVRPITCSRNLKIVTVYLDRIPDEYTAQYTPQVNTNYFYNLYRTYIYLETIMLLFFISLGVQRLQGLF